MKARRVIAPLLVGLALGGCSIDDTDGDQFGQPVEGVPGSSTATPAITAAPPLDPPPVVTTIATGLRIPWGLAFLPDGTALVTERGNPGVDDGGAARILSVRPDGTVTEIQRLSEVDVRPGEGGLLGLAVSPTYATDRFVYIYYSAAGDNRIARLRLGEPPDPIVTGLPVVDEGARFHQGGRLAFGPDGMLYASVGETYVDSEIAQDTTSLGGKILRMTPDGSPAPGNPFPGSLVWSYGHRNVQGLAWDVQARLYASELGANTYDELNIIEPGHNYGWPLAEGFSTDPAHTNPIATWTPTAAASPSGIAILGEHVYVACLRGQALYQLDLDGGDPRIVLDGYGRLRTVAVAPDGSLWVTTSNRDQLGMEVPPFADDDRILRLAFPDIDA
ncbi:MAG TPA: PQQ-dependent sugar dehydrogenase [Jiangellales bacterium]|nr:PQQ-dependent sugar dehydrogenase [Jiangellales bacterium]